MIISCNKKKLNIGNKRVIATTKICRSLPTILDNSFDGINPPEDIVVKAKLKELKSLISTMLYKKIAKIVDKK